MSIDIEELLQQYDSYIVMQVRERVSHEPAFTRLPVLELEIDELVQLVRIKFWRILQEKEIQYPRAYIKRIVNSEFIDMMRRQKQLQPLPQDTDGEIGGKLIAATDECTSNPIDIIEQQEEATECIDEVVTAILELPRRQQHVMVCSLRDRVDDLLPLVDAFQERERDIDEWQWPKDKGEKQLLRASLSYARQNVAQYMQEHYFSPRQIYV
jgi:RNA polymerase sigma factor (sigma-70 family)